MWGGKEGVDTARWACGAGRPSMLVCRVGIGADTISRDAPQASVGISWRDAADELICLMVIRWEKRRKPLKAERRERRRKRPPKRDPQRETPKETPKMTSRDGKREKKEEILHFL